MPACKMDIKPNIIIIMMMMMMMMMMMINFYLALALFKYGPENPFRTTLKTTFQHI